jgi:(p)ppGpp synthase/HD superfamily hydrolase
MSGEVQVSELLDRALQIALCGHAGQSRKGDSALPYAVHPAHMALMLARFGADVHVQAAALVHDVVEDCEEWTLEGLARELGPRVAGIVSELTEDKAKSWEERKLDGIARVGRMSSDAATVKAFDKLHNLESLRRQLKAAEHPDTIWQHFNGTPARSLELSRKLVEALAARVDPRLGRALNQSLAGVEAAAVAASSS